MNATDFLNKNKLVTNKELAGWLNVSLSTIGKMKKKVSTVQSLALDALHEKQRVNNLIELEVREWSDKNGNTNFTAYVYFKGEVYFIGFTYGDAKHAEKIALSLLVEKGLISDGLKVWDLRDKYNITFNTTSETVDRKADLFDGRLIKKGE